MGFCIGLMSGAPWRRPAGTCKTITSMVRSYEKIIAVLYNQYNDLYKVDTLRNTLIHQTLNRARDDDGKKRLTFQSMPLHANFQPDISFGDNHRPSMPSILDYLTCDIRQACKNREVAVGGQNVLEDRHSVNDFPFPRILHGNTACGF